MVEVAEKIEETCMALECRCHTDALDLAEIHHCTVWHRPNPFLRGSQGEHSLHPNFRRLLARRLTSGRQEAAPLSGQPQNMRSTRKNRGCHTLPAQKTARN